MLTPEEILIDALTNAYNFGRADSTYLPTEVAPSLIDRLAKAQDVCPECEGTGQSGVKVAGAHTDCRACEGTGRKKTGDEIRAEVLDENQELPGCQFYSWKSSRQEESMARYQTGKISKEEHNDEFTLIHNEELEIYKKAQRDMLIVGFRKAALKEGGE